MLNIILKNGRFSPADRDILGLAVKSAPQRHAYQFACAAPYGTESGSIAQRFYDRPPGIAAAAIDIPRKRVLQVANTDRLIWFEILVYLRTHRGLLMGVVYQWRLILRWNLCP